MKIIAVASAGGHWNQLLRLRPAFDNAELVFVSIKPSFYKMVEGNRFYAVPDGNRNEKIKMIKAFRMLFNIIRLEKPDILISTGAAAGLLSVVAGKMLGCKTIWIDSIANVKRLSLSGRIASILVDRIYTQWPDLATTKILYAGNVLL